MTTERTVLVLVTPDRWKEREEQVSVPWCTVHDAEGIHENECWRFMYSQPFHSDQCVVADGVVWKVLE